MRLFVALPIPDAVNARCDEIVTDLKGARWVKPEHRHLTLRFLGEGDEAAAARLVDALDARSEALTRFEARLIGLGTFGRHRPRVLYTAMAPPAELGALAATVEEASVAAGFAPEGRPFRAHVTLARLKRVDRRALARLMDAHLGFATEPFAAERIELVESTLTSEGPRYSTRHEWPLKESEG